MRKTGLLLLALMACTVPFLLRGDDAGTDTGRDAHSTARDDHTAADGAAAFRSTNWSRAIPKTKRDRDARAYSPLDDLERRQNVESARALAAKRRATARRLEGVEIVLPMPTLRTKEEQER